MSELQIMRCSSCKAAAFPDRLRCSHCGATCFSQIPAGPGVVEEETTVHRAPTQAGEPIRIGSVRLDAGPTLVVRLASHARRGARVAIDRNADGTLRASALQKPSARD